MNYLKQYIKLVRAAEVRPPEDLNGVYTEKHHIFPKSVFGQNSRLVVLTYKEHMVAHHLLYKSFAARYGETDSRTIKMAYALSFLVRTEYKYDKAIKARAIGRYIKNTTKLVFKHSAETIHKMRIAHQGKVISKEQKLKLRKAHLGRKLNEKQLQYRLELGLKHSEETKERMSRAHKGVKKSKNHCKAISEARKRTNGSIARTKFHSFYYKENNITENNVSIKYLSEKYNLNKASLSLLTRHKIPVYRGWSMI